MGYNYGSGSYGHFYEKKGFSARICPGCRCKQRKCSSCDEHRPSEKPSRSEEDSVFKNEHDEGNKE